MPDMPKPDDDRVRCPHCGAPMVASTPARPSLPPAKVETWHDRPKLT